MLLGRSSAAPHVVTPPCFRCQQSTTFRLMKTELVREVRLLCGPCHRQEHEHRTQEEVSRDFGKFHAVVKERRAATSMTYDALAAGSGITKQSLIKIEKHGADPRWTTAVRVLEALGLEVIIRERA
jgi:DNA-binding XRE family transcriptional regulator